MEWILIIGLSRIWALRSNNSRLNKNHCSVSPHRMKMSGRTSPVQSLFLASRSKMTQTDSISKRSRSKLHTSWWSREASSNRTTSSIRLRPMCPVRLRDPVYPEKTSIFTLCDDCWSSSTLTCWCPLCQLRTQACKTKSYRKEKSSSWGSCRQCPDRKSSKLVPCFCTFCTCPTQNRGRTPSKRRKKRSIPA